MLPDALEIAVEEMARLGREKFREVRTDAVLGLVAERVCGSRIDRQQTTVQIVRADEPQTVLDQVAISPLALFERLFRLLPGCGDFVELTRSLQACASGRARPHRSPGATIRKERNCSNTLLACSIGTAPRTQPTATYHEHVVRVCGLPLSTRHLPADPEKFQTASWLFSSGVSDGTFWPRSTEGPAVSDIIADTP